MLELVRTSESELYFIASKKREKNFLEKSSGKSKLEFINNIKNYSHTSRWIHDMGRRNNRCVPNSVTRLVRFFALWAIFKAFDNT